MHALGIGLQITRYYSVQCLGQTCTDVIHIREVPYTLNLSRVGLDSIQVM
jgi:hypothetical protein